MQGESLLVQSVCKCLGLKVYARLVSFGSKCMQVLLCSKCMLVS